MQNDSDKEIVFKVHRGANIFPMLPSDELNDLAISIENDGLLQPVVLWKDGQGEVWLIDGRNRTAACKLKNIPLRYNWFEGTEDEVLAYIAATNINRRHLKKAQTAMAYAMLYPEPKKRGSKAEAPDSGASIVPESGASIVPDSGVSRQRLGDARQVLKFAPELAQDILWDKGLGLDAAIEKVRKLKIEQRQTNAEMSRLETLDSELAEMVKLGKMQAARAFEIIDDRRKEAEKIQKEQRNTFCNVSYQAYLNIIALANEDFKEELEKQLKDPIFRKEYLKSVTWHASDTIKEDLPKLKKGAAILTQIIQKLMEIKNA